MKIKFILDRFKEQDRKQLELIKKIINEKPSKVDRDALFLRKFMLAILQQYNKDVVKEKEEINLEHNLPRTPQKINLEFKIPQAPSPIKLDINLEAPKNF